MKRILLFLLAGMIGCATQTDHSLPQTVNMSKAELLNKIKGGWAGQVIGVTYGGPTEFRFNGTMINDYVPIAWYDGYIKETMQKSPGLYDDLYMDLTFVEVFEKHGLEAPVDAHADAYAKAAFRLWHANQAGRYNILNGIKPPESGHWINNPHADDIDFQIESDFAGLMSPGMPNTAAQIGDDIGHIMNYGDGWYGGVFVSGMYALAFVSSDVQFIVNEALKLVPEQSTFYQCIKDVVQWHKKYPYDWKQTWFEIQRKWTDEVGCPDGVFVPFNIDAKVNAAYIALGLLYGEGDYTKTIEISTRAGQDSDCNPSSAAGILGTMIGYENIPDYWKQGLAEAEDIKFQYTTMSLNDAYQMSLKHALEVITRNDGKVDGDNVSISVQRPEPVRLEQSFPNHHPVEKRTIRLNDNQCTFEFDGVGFVVRGSGQPKGSSNWNYFGDFVYHASLSVDGSGPDTVLLPVSFTTRRHELFWKYALPSVKHKVDIKVLNPSPEFELNLWDVIVYRDKTTH